MRSSFFDWFVDPVVDGSVDASADPEPKAAEEIPHAATEDELLDWETWADPNWLYALARRVKLNGRSKLRENADKLLKALQNRAVVEGGVDAGGGVHASTGGIRRDP